MRKIIIASAAVTLIVAGAAALVAAPPEADARRRIVETAASFQGVPYVYGAESPEAFDCSGFVQYVYAHAAAIDLPRNSTEQWAAGKPIDASAVKPGDIFVFDTVGSGRPSHVAIFLGGDKMIHAVSEGPKTGVIVSPVGDRYFGPRMIGARYFIISAAPAALAAPKSAAPVPKPAAPKPVQAAPVVSEIGFFLKAKPEVVTDKIPAATGTAIAFTITNATGKGGTFHTVFYKAELDFSKTKILREDRTRIPSGGSVELAPYLFTEPGVYRLNVKSADNTQFMQRTWKVVAVK